MKLVLAATLAAAAVSTAVLADPPGASHGRHQGGQTAQTCGHGTGHAQGAQAGRGHHGNGHHRMARHDGSHGGHQGMHGRRGHGAQHGNAGAGCPMHEPAKNT